MRGSTWKGIVIEAQSYRKKQQNTPSLTSRTMDIVIEQCSVSGRFGTESLDTILSSANLAAEAGRLCPRGGELWLIHSTTDGASHH